jgi:hypothetical protein
VRMLRFHRGFGLNDKELLAELRDARALERTYG